MILRKSSYSEYRVFGKISILYYLNNKNIDDSFGNILIAGDKSFVVRN